MHISDVELYGKNVAMLAGDTNDRYSALRVYTPSSNLLVLL
jgi:hypothetical protein